MEQGFIPKDRGELAGWFAEAVRSELAALEKEGGEQNYEVLSGKPIDAATGSKGVFQFILADGTRLPEDATGRLKTPSDEFEAAVVAQLADRIHLELEGKGPLPSGIPRATLIIDDTALLRKLAETLENCKANPSLLNPIASQVFHPETASVGSVSLLDIPIANALDSEKRMAIEQACGSCD